MANKAQDFLIRFKTMVSGRGAKEMRDDLKQVEDSAKDAEKELKGVGRASRRVNRSGRTASRGLDAVNKSVDKLNRSTSGKGGLAGFVGSLAKLPGHAKLAAVAVAALASQTGAYIAALKRGEAAQLFDERRNRQLFRAQQLTEQTTRTIEELASMMEKSTGTADEFWQAVFTELITDGVGVEKLRGYADILLELTDYFGSSEAAAAALNKALENNFDAFEKAGAQFEKSATRAETFRTILEQVTLENDVNKRSSEGLEKTYDRLKNSVGNLGDEVGELVVALDGGKTEAGLNLLATGFQKLNGLFQRGSSFLGRYRTDLSATTASTSELAAQQKNFNTVLEDLPDKPLRDAADNAERAATNLESMAEGIRKIADAQNSLDDAKLRTTLAVINRMETVGKIGGEQADVLRARARGAAEIRAARRDQAAVAAEVADLRKERDKIASDLSEAQSTGSAAEQDRLMNQLGAKEEELALARKRLREQQIRGTAVGVEAGTNVLRANKGQAGDLKEAAIEREKKRLNAIADREEAQARAARAALEADEGGTFRSDRRRRAGLEAVARRESEQARVARDRATALEDEDPEAVKQALERAGDGITRTQKQGNAKTIAAINDLARKLIAQSQQSDQRLEAEILRISNQLDSLRTD